MAVAALVSAFSAAAPEATAATDGLAGFEQAIWTGDLADVQRRVAAGIDVNRRLPSGQVPIQAAVVGGHVDVLEVLIAAGADLDVADRKGVTLLMLAAKLGQTDIARALLVAGVDRARRDSSGRTASQLARRRGHDEIAALIEGRTPLSVASRPTSSPTPVPPAPSVATPQQRPAIPADGRRVALVIGNSKYADATPLANPANDATALAAALENLGFDVHLVTEASTRQLQEALRAFGTRLEDSTLSFFFFAGHAIQVGGHNYILPVNARLERESDLAYDAIDLSVVMSEMENRSRTRILILDACRNNPFVQRLASSMPASRSLGISRGLAITRRASVGTLVAYATAPDEVAADGSGRHSPYTTALLRWLGEPGLEIGQMFRRVREEVIQETGGRQIPWESSSLVGEGIYLRPR